MALIAGPTEEVFSRFQRGYNRRQKKSERSEILIATGKASIIQLSTQSQLHRLQNTQRDTLRL